jgi:Xaa-Pro dipeptidase
VYHFFGSVPEVVKKLFGVMLEARQMAFEHLIPDANMGENNRDVNRYLKYARYEKNLLHRTGHGIGITGHEDPFLAEGYDRKLKAGMMVSVEPGISIPVIGGFRHSNPGLITEEGEVSLTDAPVELEDLSKTL